MRKFQIEFDIRSNFLTYPDVQALLYKLKEQLKTDGVEMIALAVFEEIYQEIEVLNPEERKKRFREEVKRLNKGENFTFSLEEFKRKWIDKKPS